MKKLLKISALLLAVVLFSLPVPTVKALGETQDIDVYGDIAVVKDAAENTAHDAVVKVHRGDDLTFIGTLDGHKVAEKMLEIEKTPPYTLAAGKYNLLKLSNVASTLKFTVAKTKAIDTANMQIEFLDSDKTKEVYDLQHEDTPDSVVITMTMKQDYIKSNFTNYQQLHDAIVTDKLVDYLRIKVSGLKVKEDAELNVPFSIKTDLTGDFKATASLAIISAPFSFNLVMSNDTNINKDNSEPAVDGTDSVVTDKVGITYIVEAKPTQPPTVDEPTDVDTLKPIPDESKDTPALPAADGKDKVPDTASATAAVSFAFGAILAAVAVVAKRK